MVIKPWLTITGCFSWCSVSNCSIFLLVHYICWVYATMKRWTEMTIKITRFARESKIHNMHIYCWYTFPFYVVGTRGKEWLNSCFTRKIYWRCRILDEPAELIPVDGQSRENSERAAGRNSRWLQAAPVQIGGWSTHAAFAAESGAADYQPANAER